MGFRWKRHLSFAIVSSLLIFASLFLAYSISWKISEEEDDAEKGLAGVRMIGALHPPRMTKRGKVRIDIEEDRPCNHARFLFVQGTGRSGSTTLRGFLNSIPGYWIAGENWGSMVSLSAFLRRLRSIPGTMIRQPGVFENHFDFGNIKNDLRRTIIDVISPVVGDRVIGFKEVKEANPEVFLFLKELFPCMKLVLNFRRNVTAQAHTKMHSMHHINSEALLRQNQMMMDFHEKHPEWTYLMPLEDYDIVRFDRLLDWLGETKCRTRFIPHSHQMDTYISDPHAWNSTVCT